MKSETDPNHNASFVKSQKLLKSEKHYPPEADRRPPVRPPTTADGPPTSADDRRPGSRPTGEGRRMASSVPPPREGSGPHGVVYAEEVDVPNALERLWSTLFGESEAFRLKRRALLMRALQMLFGLLAVVLSTCYDLPRAVPVRVKRDGFVLIDAGVISSMFAFPAYVYLTTIAVITFVGSMLFALLLLVDLSLVGGSSEHESVRYKIDNNAPYLALCFDFIFLILATTSACASFGLTNVMHMSLDYGAMSFAPKIERVFETIFDFKVGAGV